MGPDGITPADGNAGPAPAADAHPADPLLSLRDASKSFGAVQAIVHGSIDLATAAKRTPWWERTAPASRRW